MMRNLFKVLLHPRGLVAVGFLAKGFQELYPVNVKIFVNIELLEIQIKMFFGRFSKIYMRSTTLKTKVVNVGKKI